MNYKGNEQFDNYERGYKEKTDEFLNSVSDAIHSMVSNHMKSFRKQIHFQSALHWIALSYGGDANFHIPKDVVDEYQKNYGDVFNLYVGLLPNEDGSLDVQVILNKVEEEDEKE